MFDQLSKRFRNFQSQRKAISELSRLSDRELADMGLGRGSIRQAVKTGLTDR